MATSVNMGAICSESALFALRPSFLTYETEFVLFVVVLVKH